MLFRSADAAGLHDQARPPGQRRVRGERRLQTHVLGQGRHPEALDTIDSLPQGAPVPDDLQVFLLGLHANLLAAMGRWGEADGVLREGLHRHPDSDLLEDAHHSLGNAWGRYRMQKALSDSWLAGLAPLEGVALEIDELERTR